jgi:hypothetical protein
MGDVQLLEPCLGLVAKTRQTCAPGLESGERQVVVAVGKVIIEAELLLTGQVVVHTSRRLVSSRGGIGNGAKNISPYIRVRYEAVQQIDRGGIETWLRNDIAREDSRVGGPRTYCRAPT